MSRSATKRWFTLVRSPFFTFGLILTGVILCCLGFLLLAGYYSKLALAHLQQGQLAEAKRYIKSSQSVVGIYNTATFKLIPDLVVWNEFLEVTQEANQLFVETVSVTQQTLSGENQISVETLSPMIGSVHQSLQHITDVLPKTWVIKKYVSPENQAQLAAALQATNDAQTVIESLSTGKQTWVLLLQNSDELRAAGGFPGSYVLLHFDTGRLTEMVVEDIYDADGQFQGYISAPPGIREYTSSDRGLRLPDANWWPDFPTSAQTMLQFFALGDKSNIAGVVAINLDTAKSLLAVTGPLWLPDYDISVNQDNIGEVLRAERAEFFPGSSQKKHLLQLTLAQLKQKITELNSNQQLQLLEALQTSARQKELQLYSTRPALQELFTKYQVSGELGLQAFSAAEINNVCSCEPVQLALVESNVGINKVNKYVTRQHTLSFDNSSLSVSSLFTNNASPLTGTELSSLLDLPIETQPRNGNGYLNYYRLLVSPTYTVDSVFVGDTPVTSWDDEIITTASGEQLRQIGILIGIPEKSSNSVTVNFATTELMPEAVAIYKQSGISPSTYTISSPTTRHESLVSTDTLFQL